MVAPSILDSLADAIAVLDATGKAIFENAAWKHLGPLAAVSGEGARDAVREGLAAVLAGARERFDAELELECDTNGHKETRWFALTITSCPLENGRGGLVQQRDVSEDKKLIRMLRATELGMATAQRIAHVGNWIWDIRGGSIAWTDEIYRIFGRMPQEFAPTYEAFVATIHPDDRDAVTKAVNHAVEDHAPYYIEHRIVLPTSEVRLVEEQGEVEYDEHGAPIRMIGTVRDMTAQKKAEQLIRSQAEALLQVSSPLLPVSDDVVVIPLVGEVDGARAQRLMDTLLEGLERRKSSIAIIDVTGVPTVDTFTAEALIRSARAARLLGAEVLLTGVRPDVAQAFISLGVDLKGIVTLSSLQRGIAFALQRTRKDRSADGHS